MPVNRVPDWSYDLAELIGQSRRRSGIDPLYLGGTAGSGGGVGSAPGGFIGQLPQRYVTYDLDESNVFTAGSSSLVTNLDHIRARSSMVWPFTNRSGGSQPNGAVMVLDTANAESYKTTTTFSDSNFIGIVRQNTLSGSVGLLTLGGYAPIINVDGTVAIGGFLRTSNQAGKASPATSGSSPGVFGRALSSGSPQVSGMIYPGKSVY